MNENSLIPPEILKQMLDTQLKELELKQQSEENRKQIAKYNFEVAKQSLSAQERDRIHEREYKRNIYRWLIIAGVIVSIVLSLLFAFALYLNKEEIILELVRIVFYGGSGVFVGTTWQKSREISKVNKND